MSGGLETFMECVCKPKRSTAFFFYGVVRRFTNDRLDVGLVVAVTFLGTPIWHYGRSLFPAPFLLCFLLGAVYFYFVRPRPAIAGTFLALGVFIKPPFGLTAVPIALDLARQRAWGRLGAFCLPLGLGACALV